MTDAPEKIWAWEIDHMDLPPNGYYATAKVDESTSYTRTDLADARVAAAYEAAARCAQSQAGRWESDVDFTDAGTTICSAILTLTPADAQAALNRLIAEAVKAEREACASEVTNEAIQGYAEGANCGDRYSLGVQAGVAKMQEAIRNRGKDDE